MSFSNDVKEDILKSTSSGLEIIELEACLKLSVEVIISSPFRLVFLNSNMHVIRYFINLLKKYYPDVKYEVNSRTQTKLKHQTIYNCEIYDGAKKIIDDIKYFNDDYNCKDEIAKNYVKAIAYLKAAFLVKGSVNDPKTSNYHLEIRTDKETEALFLQKCINQFDLNARISKRKNSLIVYLKEKDAIVDFLRRIGANVIMNDFENVIIKRELAANINRLMNIDVANQQKTNKSSKEQLKYIKFIEYNYPLEKLDPKLLMVMKVRKENPEASLTELVNIINEVYDENITKSGLNHRLRKLKEIAVDYENRKNG